MRYNKTMERWKAFGELCVEIAQRMRRALIFYALFLYVLMMAYGFVILHCSSLILSKFGLKVFPKKTLFKGKAKTKS